MRTRGLQWIEFRSKWSSSTDEDVGTVPELTNHLRDILQAEATRRAAGELPTHAPAPIMRRKTFKQLGTATAQAALRLHCACTCTRAPPPTCASTLTPLLTLT